MQKAWAKGAASKMACFRKYLLSGGNAAAVEAVMRFTSSSELEDKDAGDYVDYEGVMAFFLNDPVKSQDFVARRRSEPHGTVGYKKTFHELKDLTYSYVVKPIKNT